MNDDRKKKSEPLLKTTVTFFNNKLSALNNNRLQLNRGKNLAKYLARSKKNIRNITPLETTMGVMSFSLYMLRFSTNLVLLIQLNLCQNEDDANQKSKRDLYYALFNDSLWSLVNFTQFFWLSYKNSMIAGLHGMQLETLAQFIDLLILLIRYQEDKNTHELKFNLASKLEQQRLEIEWQNKELNLIRSVLTGLSIATVFGLYSFSLIATPISPIICIIVLMSSLIRLLIDMKRDRELINHLKITKVNLHQVVEEERLLNRARLNELNQIVLNNLFIPLGIFFLITTPIPLFIFLSVMMIAAHYGVTHFINSEETIARRSVV